MDALATPKFCKAHTLPYSKRKAVNRLVKEGTLEPVEYSDWAVPIVAVLKGDGRIWICGDFRMIVNPNYKLNKYPIPHIEDLFATLQRGNKIYEIGFESSLSAAHIRRGIKTVYYGNQHS